MNELYRLADRWQKVAENTAPEGTSNPTAAALMAKVWQRAADELRAALLAVAPSAPGDSLDVLSLAADGAAMAHLNGWGLLSHHEGSFADCPDDRCGRNRALLARLRSEPTGATPESEG